MRIDKRKFSILPARYAKRNLILCIGMVSYVLYLSLRPPDTLPAVSIQAAHPVKARTDVCCGSGKGNVDAQNCSALLREVDKRKRVSGTLKALYALIHGTTRKKLRYLHERKQAQQRFPLQ